MEQNNYQRRPREIEHGLNLAIEISKRERIELISIRTICRDGVVSEPAFVFGDGRHYTIAEMVDYLDEEK